MRVQKPPRRVTNAGVNSKGKHAMNEPKNAVGRLEIVVPESAFDLIGHVNNVQYVQWMQDAAEYHSGLLGWPRARYAALGRHWIIRAHNIEYFHSAFLGQRIFAETWVADFKRIKSWRKFRFVRPEDGVVLAKAATLFIFCDSASGGPVRIPPEVIADYPVLGMEAEPELAL